MEEVWIKEMIYATNCMTGAKYKVRTAPDWVRRLVPEAVGILEMDGHIGALKPLEIPADEIPTEHRAQHYLIGNSIYGCVFVG